MSGRTPTDRTPDHAPDPGWKRAGRVAWSRASDRRYLPTFGTIATLILLLVIGQLRYSTDDRNFISPRLFSNLFIDNSYLLVLAIGLTFVIISGGIDLSVGGVVALVGLVVAKLLLAGLPLPVVLVAGVLVGTAIGSLIGTMVQYFRIQPFIASLAGLFLARGLANMLGTNSIAIKDEGFASLASWKLKFGEKPDIWYINLSMIVALVVLLLAVYGLHYTRFGRTVYGLGSGDGGQAAALMGLRPGATKMWVYVISGTCAGIGGILFALYTKSGYNLSGVGMELDAIASVVIGGALLTGGAGYALGTFAGVTVYGLILVICNREGLEIWWNRILIGVILLGFVLLQRVLVRKRR
ncbi:MAG: sugar ABC transporter permease YjfF [Rhodococcus sp. (in: high G+C Gram-positive bacteria)]|nr:MAG: sugar ABC transporter permease YjfF [Rhodococcus sp. (in: high G+C Gram-positive bacteria)]